MRPRATTFLGVLMSLLLLVSLAPFSTAGYRSYGEVVDGATSSDKDVTRLLTIAVATGAEVKFSDTNTDGAVSTGEGVYIDMDASGTISPLDIRVRAGTGTSGTKGDQVRTADADCCGTAIIAAPGLWGFVDVYPALVSGVCQDVACPDGGLNLGDPVFLDLDGSGTVTAADIKVTSRGSAGSGGVPTTGGSGSYTNVATSDTDFGAAITAIGGYAIAIFDANGDGVYGFGDSVYLDANADSLPGPGDVRINKASTFTAGSMPKAGDADTVHTLTGFGGLNGFLAFQDADVSGAVGTSEAVYLDLDGSGTVTINDIRLITGTGVSGASGKQVISTDSDIGAALTAVPGGFKYNNRDGDGTLDADDDVYVEMDGDGIVEVGDLRITKGIGSTVSVGQRVTASSNDLTAPLTVFPAGPVLAFFDFNGAGVYNRNDVVYIDVDANGIITPRDIRVQAGTSPLSTFGEWISDSETEMEYCFTIPFAAGAVSYVEQATAGTVNLDEPLYFDRAGDGLVSVFDIRMSADSGTAGTFVASGSSDQNNPLIVVTTVNAGAAITFYDANGDSRYSTKTPSGFTGSVTTSDTIYYDTDGSGTISVGDLRLTRPHTGSASAGSKVAGNAPSAELNAALTAFATAPPFAAVDSNGDGTFTSKDALYANVDSTVDTTIIAGGCVTPGDVRLSGPTASTSSTGGGGGGGGGVSPPPPPPPSTTPPTVSITSHANGAYVETGHVVNLAGTATGGSGGAPSVSLSVNGGPVSVSGTTSWTASFTPSADGAYTVSATASSSSGTRTATVTLNANAQGTAPATTKTCSDGSTVPTSEDCPVVDEQARADAEDAKEAAEEAKVAAERAEQTAGQARDAAQGAQTAAEQNSETANQILRQLTNGTDEPSDGVPAPGLLPLLAALGTALVVARRRRQK